MYLKLALKNLIEQQHVKALGGVDITIYAEKVNPHWIFFPLCID